MFSRKHRPLWLAWIALWGAVAGLLAVSLAQNGGHLTYTLDDPYIHLAMAKNFALSGVWGVSAAGFSSTSSSPLWTLLLAGLFKLLGVQVSAPLILNLLAATLAVWVAYRLLVRSAMPPRLIAFTLFVFVFATPLPSLVLSGMEHLLHLLLTLAFVWAAAPLLVAVPDQRRRLWRLVWLAPLITSTRFEGAFLVGLTALLFVIWGRRWRDAVIVALAGAAPILIFGLISVANGWYFFPNSVLLKANLPYSTSAERIGALLLQMPTFLFYNPPLLALLIAALFGLRWLHMIGERLAKHENAAWLVVYVPSVLLHLQFARMGWFYRYEAYLVGWGLVVVAPPLIRYLSGTWSRLPAIRWQYWAVRFGVLVGLFALGSRAFDSASQTPRATTNIYEQQVQMGTFLRDYYPGWSVAVHDIGAVDFLADVRPLDLWGLASLDVAKIMFDQKYATMDVGAIAQAHGVRIGLLYDLQLKVPKTWVKVAEWTIPQNIVCAYATVAIYAIDPAQAGSLRQNLQTFAARLPAEVVQKLF